MALISKVLANPFLDRGALCKQAQAGGLFLWEPSSHCGDGKLGTQSIPASVTEGHRAHNSSCCFDRIPLALLRGDIGSLSVSAQMRKNQIIYESNFFFLGHKGY